MLESGSKAWRIKAVRLEPHMTERSREEYSAMLDEKAKEYLMADLDGELKQKALQLHNMFKEPSTVSPKKVEDLLRWIIARARGVPAAQRAQERKGEREE